MGKYTMSLVGKDRQAVTRSVNQGIDARLEGFTTSEFQDDGHRLHCLISDWDFTVLLRRLRRAPRGARGLKQSSSTSMRR